MLRWLLDTDGGIAGLLLRLTLAVVMFPHGAQKALGWFGGQGFEQTLASFTRSGIPTGLAVLVIVTEFLGPLGLAAGLLARVVAVGFIGEMLVAILRIHWRHGFFMNWTGTQAGEGFEYHLLVIGIALTVLIIGAGLWSLDRALTGRPARPRAHQEGVIPAQRLQPWQQRALQGEAQSCIGMLASCVLPPLLHGVPLTTACAHNPGSHTSKQHLETTASPHPEGLLRRLYGESNRLTDI